MDKFASNHFDVERHLLGGLLNDDDEGFHSYDSKIYSDSGDHHGLILNDIGNKNYLCSLNNNEKFPTLASTIGAVPAKSTWGTSNRTKFHPTDCNIGSSSFFFWAEGLTTKPTQTPYSPTVVKQIQSPKTPPLQNDQRFTIVKKTNKQKTQRSKDLLLTDTPSPSVIGYNPVKSNSRREIIAREADCAKNPPRSKKDATKQLKSNSELFINVKGAQSFKSKLSPTARSSSNENVAVTGKFTALKQLTDNPKLIEALPQSLCNRIERRTEDECSSVFSGSSNDFDSEATSSRPSRRRQRLANKNSAKTFNGFIEFINLILASLFPGFVSQCAKSKNRRCKPNNYWTAFLSFLISACSYVCKAISWLMKIILNFVYQVYLVAIMLVRSLVRKVV